MWVLVGAIGALVWLAVLGFFVALCRASGLADEQAKQRVTHRRAPRPRPATERAGAQILDLGMWRAARSDRLVRAGDRLLRAR
jgi:hypothetical protein